MPVEILAPVGGKEQLIAAVRSGADAVYLGTGSFNARRKAENFDGEALEEAVRYCHGRGVKVHATLNTLVKDGELGAVYREMELLAESGVDAVLVQDLAVAALFRRHCPDMPLHASTRQMSLHNLEGVRAAGELGFSRVVLARELSLEEIRSICAGSDIEVEAFVHGALCMSVSGQCYFSAFLGERSGNRGLCAQPCRLDFRSEGRGYALSLKDMSHIARIRELAEAGVVSFKIEGRMKRPEYVAAAVLACREALEGKTPDLERLQAVFSRSGFTDGYLTGRRNLEMFGHRRKEDVEAASGVLGEIASGYRGELARIPVRMTLRLAEGEPSRLEATDGIITVAAEGEIPQPARERGTDEKLALRSLSKTGGTPFVLESLSAHLNPSLMLPQSGLGALRREALNRLLELRSAPRPKAMTGSFAPPPSRKKAAETKLRVRLEKREQAFEGMEEADRLILPLEEIDEGLIGEWGERLIGELPRLTFPGREAALEKRLSILWGKGLRHLSAGNLAGIRLGRRLGFALHGDTGLNILNTESLLQYEALGLEDATLSCEINIREAASLGGSIPRGILGYGHLPLMLFRNCPAKGKAGCGSCQGSARLTDRTGAHFPVFCRGREYSALLNSVPLYLGDKGAEETEFVTLFFTLESREECGAVWENYRRARPFPGAFTRGLTYRKLL